MAKFQLAIIVSFALPKVIVSFVSPKVIVSVVVSKKIVSIFIFIRLTVGRLASYNHS